MVCADWVKVCSNTVQLDKMAVAMAQDYGLDKDAGPPSGTDYNSQVKHCRMKVRSGGYLVPDKITGLENFSGEKVRPETTELMTMAKLLSGNISGIFWKLRILCMLQIQIVLASET